VLWVALLAFPPGAYAQAHQPEPVKEGAVAEGHTAEGEHEEGLMPTVARIANFAILVGVLAYFLRSPLAGYLKSRGEHIRAELVDAAAMRRNAEGELAEIARRMEALPGELEALRARGAADVAAEEARIRSATETERERLLEHMHRDVEMQVRIARQQLTAEAAALATAIARQRIEKTITPDDQARLFDRYTRQVEATR
jgi:F0F1-type ATP synthase membrane subunit b/b'